MSSQLGEDSQQSSGWRTGTGKVMAGGPGEQGGGWWTRWSHICMWINWEEQPGNKTDHATHGSSAGK